MDELCLDFINSLWYSSHEHKPDILDDTPQLLLFLSKYKLIIKKLPDERVMKSLNDLRAFLQDEVQSIMQSGKLSSVALNRLNLILSLSPCPRRVNLAGSGYSIKTEALISDWNWLLAEISASFLELLSENKSDRIRICENPKCGFVFYDTTKNKTKRCCCEGCANLMKIRRYRAKQKNAAGV